MDQNFTEERAFVFGGVVTVKPIPTRGVSQIIIEIPEEAHVRATELLFRKNAFIFAGAPDASIPFGVGQLGEGGMSMPEAPEPKSSGQKRGSGDNGGLNITKWLALRCKEDAFQEFLSCRNEGQAIDKVRQVCGVESRAEIQNDDRARGIFMQEIYNPFNATKVATPFAQRAPWRPV